MSRVLTRREMLRDGAVALGASALMTNRLIANALAAAPRCGTLNDIEHVVILVQENRSFDHYFGSYRGVTGFADSGALPLGDGSGLNVFAQPGYPGGYDGNHLYPFHVGSFHNGECTNDIDHSWGPQHAYWDGGKMDGFVTGHLAADGSANGPLTMGYYTRADLGFSYALADAFTICDHYFCSVIGPTDPNRLYTFSATLDPDGTHGGPILSTSATRVERFGTLSWTTMPEQLQARGISWKVYGNPDGNFGDNVLPYFKQYQTNLALAARALTPTYPGTFQTDVATGHLPSVSWVLAPLISSEHPPAPEIYGESVAADVLRTLVANPGVWKKTALLITYDENGGFFDHVPPPRRAGGHARRVADGQPTPVRRGRRRRPDRARVPRADARRLAVQPGRLRLLGHVRPHLPAALARDEVRCRGAEPDRVAPLGGRRPDERVQLRQGRSLCAVAADAEPGRSADHAVELRRERSTRSRNRLDEQPQGA